MYMKLNLRRDVRDGLKALLNQRVADDTIPVAAKTQYEDAIIEIQSANNAEDQSISGLENATSIFEKYRQKWMTQSRWTKGLSGLLFAGILVGLGFVSGPAAPIC